MEVSVEDEEAERYRAPALDKGLDILELLSSVDGGLTQSEIAKKLGRSPNEFYRMLDRLVRRGYVTKIIRHAFDARTGRNFPPGEPARRVRPRGGCRDRPTGSPRLLGYIDTCRIPYQSLRYRLRPCSAGLPFPC